MGIANSCLSQGKYGDNLRAVVMHNDEEQPHIHFYVYSDTEVNAKALHYGHKAKKNFIAAAKNFQDDYHAQVAIHCGMARLGPKRQRLTRAEWKAQQRARYENRSSGECVARCRRAAWGERSEARERTLTPPQC